MDIFYDISDEDLLKMIWLVGQHFWCKKRRKGGQRFAELFQESENISKSRFERKPESKSWWDTHLFNFWLENRQERKQDWHSQHSREFADKEQVIFFITLYYSLGAFITGSQGKLWGIYTVATPFMKLS